jgi:YidC/Oxa1 family membrane protein insertase
VKVVAVTMIVMMGATTFWTQRQMMARGGMAMDPQQQQIQKFMLYVLPFSFAIFGFGFPIGVLLYWLTTNVWSMGQQHYVIKRMPPVAAGGAAGSGGKGAAGSPAPSGKSPSPKGPGAAAELPATAEPATESVVLTATSSSGGTPGARRNAGSRKNKKKGRR